MAVAMELVTAEALEQMPMADAHIELVAGEIVSMSPAGPEHGEIALNIGSFVREFLRKHRLGKAYAAETGFILSRNPDTVRAPDVAFVTAERARRQTRGYPLGQGFFDGAPDLAVEVVSPGDTDEAVQTKILEYLQAGTSVVWIVRPRTRTVTVYRSLSDIRVLTDQDTLTCDDLLPGFSVPVSDVFAE